MCFSAGPSFATGAALLPAGVYCIRRAAVGTRRYLPLAAVPAVFDLVVYIPLAAHAREWLHTAILQHSIRCEFETSSAFRALQWIFWQLGYIAVVITPLVVTHDRRFRIFGVLLLASAVPSQAAFWDAFISVRCAFSALLSAGLCYMLMARPTGDLECPR